MSFFAVGVSYLNMFHDEITLGDFKLDPSWNMPLLKDIKIIDAEQLCPEEFPHVIVSNLWLGRRSSCDCRASILRDSDSTEKENWYVDESCSTA